MQMQPLIGIPCAGAFTPSGAARLQLNRSYEQAVREAGGLPLLLAPGLSLADADRVVQLIDGLLLPGGVDVDPARYRAEPHPTTQVDAEQDALEFPLAERALAAGRPVLAICRGIQLLTVACGGTLWQDLPSERPTALRHRGEGVARDAPLHQLRLAPDSALAGLLGNEHVPVNSFHHQGLRELGRGLRAVGWADDGLVEAVEGPGRFTIGLQCHPEDLVVSQPVWRRLFAGFVGAARRGD